MPSKRDVLGVLNRAELLAFVDETGLEVGDRRKRELLIDALAGSRRARLPEYLGKLARTRLHEISRSLGGGDSGRDKAGIIDRMLGSVAAAVKKSAGSATKAPRKSIKASTAVPAVAPRSSTRATKSTAGAAKALGAAAAPTRRRGAK